MAITFWLCAAIVAAFVLYVYGAGKRRRIRRRCTVVSAAVFAVASTLLGLYLSGVIWNPQAAQDSHPKLTTVSWTTYLKSATHADLTCAQKVLGVNSKRAHQLAATEAKKGNGDDTRGIVVINDKTMTGGQAKTALAQHFPQVNGLYVESATAVYLYSGAHCTASVYATSGAYLTLTIPTKGGKTFVANKGVLVKGGKYYVWKAVPVP
jgi:hypothetical protein